MTDYIKDGIKKGNTKADNNVKTLKPGPNAGFFVFIH
jgi:hypothetical protein